MDEDGIKLQDRKRSLWESKRLMAWASPSFHKDERASIVLYNCTLVIYHYATEIFIYKVIISLCFFSCSNFLQCTYIDHCHCSFHDFRLSSLYIFVPTESSFGNTIYNWLNF